MNGIICLGYFILPCYAVCPFGLGGVSLPELNRCETESRQTGTSSQYVSSYLRPSVRVDFFLIMGKCGYLEGDGGCSFAILYQLITQTRDICFRGDMVTAVFLVQVRIVHQTSGEGGRIGIS